MTEPIKIDFNRPVPLFPLPNCVLLPGATIPLHIFEPRYRSLTSTAIDAHGLMAMALFDGDRWKTEYEANPPVRAHVCVGYIVHHDQFEDGRYNILLQGVCRARMVREVPHKPFRTAILEPTEDGRVMEIDLLDDRRHLETLLRDPFLSRLESLSRVENWLSHEVPTATLIDLALMAICEGLDDRYAMLTETDVQVRFHFLDRLLRDTRSTLEMADRFGVGEPDDGVYPN